jgi:hypothetical protein
MQSGDSYKWEWRSSTSIISWLVGMCRSHLASVPSMKMCEQSMNSYPRGTSQHYVLHIIRPAQALMDLMTDEKVVIMKGSVETQKVQATIAPSGPLVRGKICNSPSSCIPCPFEVLLRLGECQCWLVSRSLLSLGKNFHLSACLVKLNEFPWENVNSGTWWSGGEPNSPPQLLQCLEESSERRDLIEVQSKITRNVNKSVYC